jgi:hypothetical protein
LDTERRASRLAILVGLSLCLLVRVGSVLGNWWAAQPILAEYEHALDGVPPGQRILVLLGTLASTSADRSPPLEHVPTFAAAKQQDFVSYTFHHAAVPLQMQPAFKRFSGRFAPYPELARYMADYDYVLAIREPRFVIPDGLALTRMAQGMSYTLYRIERR